MKSADRKLAYSVVVVLAVIAAEIAWFLFVGPTDHHPNYAAKCESNCEIPWWFSDSFWMVFFTAILTGSTALLWKETRRLAEGADDQLKITQRAYISVEPEGIRRLLKPLGYIISSIGIQNCGHLPATKVRWLICQQFSPDKRLKDFPINPEQVEGSNLLPPGTNMIQGGDVFHAPIETFDPVGLGMDQYLYVWGIVLYKDGLSEPDRITRFCHRYNCRNLDGRTITGGFGRFHRYGNEAD